MSDLLPHISFPGIPAGAIRSASFTLGHGITPSACTIRVVPNTKFAKRVGTLELRFGDVHLKFKDCQLASARAEMAAGRGTTVSLRILDRRWKWEYGSISGRYNVRAPGGDIDKKLPKRNAQQLAKLLLKEMSEEQVDVSALPTFVVPETQWDDANPARELAGLAEKLGCRVVLGSDDKISIRKTGDGKKLPAGALLINAGAGLEKPVPPDKVKLICGPTLYHSHFELEAVGEDTDGQIKPIGELSYRPDEGWQGSATAAKDSEFTGPSGEKLRTTTLAAKTVWRWYRIKHQASGGLGLPGAISDDSIKSIDQYEFKDHAMARVKGDIRNPVLVPVYVDGVFFNETVSDGANTSSGTPYPHDFSFDPERRLVIFGNEVFRQLDDASYAAARIYLGVAYHLRIADDGRLARYSKTRKIANKPHGTGAMILRRPEMRLLKLASYSPPAAIPLISDNRDILDDEVKRQIDAVVGEFERVDATSDSLYAGWLDISPDGAIQQVTWEVGPQGATTRASRNTESNPFVPTFQQNRRKERAARVREREES